MKPRLYVVLAAAILTGCVGRNTLLQALNRILVSGTVQLDDFAEPATVRLLRESTGALGDSDATVGVSYELADEWDGSCAWRVEVEFTNIVADSAFLANLSGPLVAEGLGCGRHTVNFALSTNGRP